MRDSDEVFCKHPLVEICVQRRFRGWNDNGVVESLRYTLT